MIGLSLTSKQLSQPIILRRYCSVYYIKFVMLKLSNLFFG